MLGFELFFVFCLSFLFSFSLFCFLFFFFFSFSPLWSHNFCFSILIFLAWAAICFCIARVYLLNLYLSCMRVICFCIARERSAFNFQDGLSAYEIWWISANIFFLNPPSISIPKVHSSQSAIIYDVGLVFGFGFWLSSVWKFESYNFKENYKHKNGKKVFFFGFWFLSLYHFLSIVHRYRG